LTDYITYATVFIWLFQERRIKMQALDLSGFFNQFGGRKGSETPLRACVSCKRIYRVFNPYITDFQVLALPIVEIPSWVTLNKPYLESFTCPECDLQAYSNSLCHCGVTDEQLWESSDDPDTVCLSCYGTGVKGGD
jgi:hypothetical protein